MIPEGVKKIGDMAFAHCTALRSIMFPESLKTFEMGFGLFEEVDDVTIHAPIGSVAEQYAKEMGIPFEGI